MKFLMVTVLLCGVAFAEEGKEESKAAQPEAAAAGGGQVSREYIEYQKLVARLNSLKSRIDEADKRFAEVVKAKNETKDSEVQRAYADELITIAKDRNKWVGEYTTVRQDVLYRYPNKGEDINKRFLPNQKRSAAELEGSSDLDDQLTAVKKSVDQKYKSFMPAPEATPSIAADAKSGTASGAGGKTSEPKKRLRLEK